MAEQKTLPTDASVDEFLESAATPRRREEGRKVADLMREVTATDPVMWGPSMVGYGSFHYVSPKNPRTRGIWPKVAFSPRKAQLTFYGLKDTPEGEGELAHLGPHTTGAGCVYVKRLDQIDRDVLARLVEIAFARGDYDATDA